MIKETFSHNPDEVRIEQLTDILTTSIKTGEMDERIWDYTSMRVPSFARMRWEDEIDFSERVQQMLRETDEVTQNYFQVAATNTLKQWDIEKDSTEQLTESLYIISYTSATQAIPQMISIINNPLLDEKPGEEFLKITSLIGGIFHGFAEIEGIKDEIKPAIDTWLYDPRFKKLTGQFMGVISKCSPEDFARYYQRVFDVNKELDFFVMDFVLEDITEDIPEDIIKNHLSELSDEARSLLQSYLDSQVN